MTPSADSRPPSASLPPALRAPLILALVVLLGAATRWFRSREAMYPEGVGAQPALDSQLARTDAARLPANRVGSGGTSTRRARAPRTKGSSTAARTAAETGVSSLPPPPPPTLRTEVTPFGAMSPEALRDLERSRSHPSSSTARQPPSARFPRQPTSARTQRQPAPAAPQEPINLDTATPSQLERLPRIGPTLARRIVNDRKANGPFGSLEGFQRVKGVGPALARQLQGLVTFGGAGRPSHAEPRAPAPLRRR